MARQIDGVALGSVAVGSLLMFAGLKGKSIPSAISAIVKGQSPAKAASANPITGSGTVVPDNPAGGSATGQQIAADALAYQGEGYVWGGAPAQGLGNWDCSSFANWVIGHDLHLAIPGYAAGTYTGESHGPTTLLWLAWTGCTTIKRQDVGAGDLCVWQTHMGIAISNSQMISAQNPQSGTQVSGIDGFIPGEALFCRRLNATLPTPGSSGGKK